MDSVRNGDAATFIHASLLQIVCSVCATTPEEFFSLNCVHLICAGCFICPETSNEYFCPTCEVLLTDAARNPILFTTMINETESDNGHDSVEVVDAICPGCRKDLHLLAMHSLECGHVLCERCARAMAGAICPACRACARVAGNIPFQPLGTNVRRIHLQLPIV